MHSNNQSKVSSWNDILNILLWLIINFQDKKSKMASVVKYIVVLAMFIQIAQSGIMTISICPYLCEIAANACVAAATASTAGAGLAAAIIACKASEGACLYACIACTP